MRWFYRIAYSLIWPFVMIFNPPRTSGRENVPEGAALFCINHQSIMDPLILCVSLGVKHWLHFMAKDEAMRAPVLGKLLRMCGTFGVKRGRSDIKSIKTALAYLKSGEKVAIFPQGTRIPNDLCSEYKTGAAMLSIRAHVPVVPVYMENCHGRPFRRIRVIIGKAFSLVGREGQPRTEQYRSGAEEIFQNIKALADMAGAGTEAGAGA